VPDGIGSGSALASSASSAAISRWRSSIGLAARLYRSKGMEPEAPASRQRVQRCADSACSAPALRAVLSARSRHGPGVSVLRVGQRTDGEIPRSRRGVRRPRTCVGRPCTNTAARRAGNRTAASVAPHEHSAMPGADTCRRLSAWLPRLRTARRCGRACACPVSARQAAHAGTTSPLVDDKPDVPGLVMICR